MATRNVRNIERELEMVHMAQGGKSLREIAAHFGVSRQRVHVLVRRHVGDGSHASLFTSVSLSHAVPRCGTEV